MLGLAACRTGRRASAVTRRLLHPAPHRAAPNPPDPTSNKKCFNPELLSFLVCPLSHKPLRYEESTNELINEELGIAYPIIDGMPNMIPQDARMIQKEKKQEEPEQSQH
ncbi:protein preY, mitochondrial [Microcaecilia unicolor]|uniref:Protein preY, mitochondrial n=1 Tax=Microcaecilia unicolor TaxID=1415580 RepID=A0A6P7X241_9AMPH|nr:protein preY, mitochondrial [Microcaecilia unicolor]